MIILDWIVVFCSIGLPVGEPPNILCVKYQYDCLTSRIYETQELKALRCQKQYVLLNRYQMGSCGGYKGVNRGK